MFHPGDEIHTTVEWVIAGTAVALLVTLTALALINGGFSLD